MVGRPPAWPCGTEQGERLGDGLALAGQNLFLQSQYGVQVVPAQQQFTDPRQGQAQAFQGQYLVQAGDLGGSVSPPASLRTQRRQQAALLIEPQSLDTDAETAGDFLGAEMTVHAKHILSTNGFCGPDPGGGARAHFSSLATLLIFV